MGYVSMIGVSVTVDMLGRTVRTTVARRGSSMRQRRAIQNYVLSSIAMAREGFVEDMATVLKEIMDLNANAITMQ